MGMSGPGYFRLTVGFLTLIASKPTGGSGSVEAYHSSGLGDVPTKNPA